MTVTAIRKKLIDYLSEAEADKVKAIYTLLEHELADSYTLTEEQWAIVDAEREKHIAGISKSYSKEEAFAYITGK